MDMESLNMKMEIPMRDILKKAKKMERVFSSIVKLEIDMKGSLERIKGLGLVKCLMRIWINMKENGFVISNMEEESKKLIYIGILMS